MSDYGDCVFNDYGYGPRRARYLGTKPDGRIYLEVRYSNHQGRKLAKRERVNLKGVKEFQI